MSSLRESAQQTNDAMIQFRFAIDAFISVCYTQVKDSFIHVKDPEVRKQAEIAMSYLQRDVQNLTDNLRQGELELTSYKALCLLLARLEILKEQMDSALIVLHNKIDKLDLDGEYNGD